MLWSQDFSRMHKHVPQPHVRGAFKVTFHVKTRRARPAVQLLCTPL